MLARSIAVAILLCACGGDDGSQNDASADAVSNDVATQETAVEAAPPKVDAGYPGPHPDAPQVQDFGGAVLAAPNVIPIFFQNDPAQTDVETFLGQLASSTFWSSTMSEYEVGALTIAKSVVVTDTPPPTITSAKIESWLDGYLDGTHAEFPAIATNNVYVVFYPSQTTIQDNVVGTGCVSYGGYHDESQNASKQSFVYAVMPRCSTFGYLSGLDALTGPLSHEIEEAATDPHPQTDTAYAAADPDHMVWNLAPLGELGDMCAYEPQSFQKLVGSYMVQRLWSNTAAKAGHDPCAPALATPYYNAAPVMNDVVTLDYYGQNVTTKGVQITVGDKKTVDVQLFSDAPAADWSVTAVDETYGTSDPKQLDFTWDAQTGNNGDTLHMTITRLANGSHNGTELYIYASRDQKTWNMWFGFVQN
ncbi:MAG TPA: hypothetical protein VH054_04655 [Polyangiaceae bacterium]|jgi:hypothetical protein|nr:hypothetical protein [Polyangiaceae bacterium]